MRLPVFSLRTGILAQLIFLIVAAMLLINVVMIKFSERDLVRAKIQSGKLLIRALEQDVGRLPLQGEVLQKIFTDERFRHNAEKLLSLGQFSEVTVIDRKGYPVFHSSPPHPTQTRDIALARKAMETKTWVTEFHGMTWGVIWLSNSEIHLAAPLFHEGRMIGGVHIGASLTAVYRSLRKTENIILFYLMLDTIILALVGIFLLSRIVVKPIHQLLKLTSEYKDGDLVPSLAQEPRNEIGQLSRSLNHLLKRLEENKRVLRDHISSLEKANRDLKEAQNEIIKSEKLASVGRLAAGIAHEIGNPIGVVLGYLDLIKKGDLTREEKEDFLDRMESEINRVSSIIRHLLDFSRPSSGRLVETTVHDLIRDAMKILKPQPMMEGIRIRLQLKANRDRILADPNQLQQVFVNIMMNAADAHAEEGRQDKAPRRQDLDHYLRKRG
ncbi:MAG: histidine kinase dimerization/phospho-acceptor domain-containing protein [Pseudomonadota bacterium]